LVTPLSCTPRELEVLQLIAEGNANKQVAAELGISVKTVEKHRHNIMEELHLYHSASLTRYAITKGIIEGSAQMTTLPGPTAKVEAKGSPR
jgi:DNA-binding NarL/FixJ family response regulator